MLTAQRRIANSYVRNCFIQARDGEAPLFNGDAVVRLDGYAIIPIEEYESLKRGGDLMEPNVYVLIARAVNGSPLTGPEAQRVIEHYQNTLNAKTEIISRIRETLNAFTT